MTLRVTSGSFTRWNVTATSPTEEFIYAGGTLPIAEIDNGSTVEYGQADTLSVRMVTNSSGTAIEQQGDYPYGEMWYQSASDTDFQFGNYLRDSGSDNDYAYAREYVNRLARFSTLDPVGGNVGNPLSWNRYTYALDNPISVTDPTGLRYAVCFNGGVCLYPEQLGDLQGQGAQLIFQGGVVFAWISGKGGGQKMVGTYEYIPDTPPLLAAVGRGAQVASGPVHALFYGTMAFLGGFGPGILEDSLALPEAGLTGGAELGREAGSAATARSGSETAVDVNNLNAKILRQMASRGWTRQEILDTVENGKPFSVINKATGGPATEYLNPTNGRFVVVDDATRQVLQVSGPGFLPNHMVP